MAPKQSKTAFPTPNDWSRLAPNLGRWSRPINISLPCIGIDGAGFALKAMKVPFTAINIYDLERRYARHLEKNLGHTNYHLGEDFTKVNLDDMERPCDMVISGPPCPPWAGNGNHKGLQDARADVFMAVIKMVLAFIKTGELKAAVIENVKGILNKIRGQDESFMEEILIWLRQEASEFDWQVVVLKAQDYRLAQQRTRVFLRGMRTSCGCGEVPAPLEPFGPKTLMEFLNPHVPSVNWCQLTNIMTQNLKDAKATLINMLKNGDVGEEDIVIFPLDRAEGKVYVRRFSTNCCPTLTTTNKYLFVASMDFTKQEKQQRFFRFLHPSERMLLQGFPANVLEGCTDALRVQGSGNAYPVPLMVAVLAPILSEIKDSIADPEEFLPVDVTKITSLCNKLQKSMTKQSVPNTTMKKLATSKSTKAKGASKGSKKAKGASKGVKKAMKKKVTPAQKRCPKTVYRWFSSSSEEI